MDGFLGFLPYALLFLLCPLVMLFMHRGGSHDGRHAEHHTHDRAEPAWRTQPSKDRVRT